MAAAVVSHNSARIGDVADMQRRGIISHANRLAIAANCSPGAACACAGMCLMKAPLPIGTPPAYEETLNRYILFQWNRIRALVQQKLHCSHSNQISLDEWLAYYDIVLNDATYQDELMLLPEAVFNVMDVDQSGLLDKGEWADLFRVYNIPVIYVEETFHRIDVDGDGRLSKTEVIAMIQDFLYSSDPGNPANYMFGPI
jgi:hypothetical protein